jgi:class 3 adenylate cyclase
MLKQARKIARESLLYGFLLTVIVVVASAGGMLDNVERWLYDKRMATCQFFTPPPTDKLVHLDIDDSVLEAVGAWPWPREVLADMFNELRQAGPKVVATDVLFSEPQRLRYEKQDDGTFKSVNDDQLLGNAIKNLNCVIVPMSLPFDVPEKLSPLQKQLREDLRINPELSDTELVQMLSDQKLGRLPAIQSEVALEFLKARREQIYLLIREQLLKSPDSMERMQRQILRHTEPDETTAAVRVYRDEYQHASAELALRQFEPAIPPGLPRLLSSDKSLPPVPRLAEMAAGTAFFDYPTEKDGKVRRVPLFMEYDGRMVPQIGLSVAAAMLGAKTESLIATPNSVEIPRPGGTSIALPVYSIYSDTYGRQIPMMFDIPWFGTADWQTMYDKVGGAHRSLNTLWDIGQTRQKIVKNNKAARESILAVYELYDKDQQHRLEKTAWDLADGSVGLAEMKSVLQQYKDYFDAAQHPDPTVPFKTELEKLNNDKFAASGLAISHAVEENPQLIAQLAQQRAFLRQLVHDKAVLIGWAATASVADLVPTSLHAKCPGVVIHGTIFNAIMTGRFLTRIPEFGNLSITLLFGLVTTVLASRLSPTRACIYAIGIAVFYTAFNGIFLFDYMHRIVDLAGPLTAVALVWAGCTLTRLLAESLERARITRRFSTYADPRLVRYVSANPDNVTFGGEKREVTVCFTDLEKFTSIAETLGEAAVPLLNEFFSMALPIIDEHGGYVNKFLGDGIMFFFGAPEPVPDHAARALDTVLALNAAMIHFNRGMLERGLPRLNLRVGISTGEMLVGDAGTAERSDYTVLGDNVNLGSRLESANKALGTKNLANHRAVEMAGDKFLVRPIGNIRYVGKQLGVFTYEIIARRDSADDYQLKTVEHSRAVVDAYAAGDLPACLEAIGKMETDQGPDKFTALMRDLCETRLRDHPGEKFDPLIVLTDK